METRGLRLRTVCACALAACACAAWLGAYFGAAYGGVSALIACWLLFLAARAQRSDGRTALACALLGAAFALWRVLGFSYDAIDSYGYVMHSARTLLRAGLAWLALAAASACALLLLFALLTRAGERAGGAEAPEEGECRRLFFLCAGLIFAGSIPYLILYAPGLNIFDTHDQILQFFGFPSYIGDGGALSDHHPVFLTLVYGGFMRLGLLLGDANLGQLLYSLLSMAAIALCFSLVLVELRRGGLRGGAAVLLALGIALYPVLALYAFNMCKDVSAAPFVLLLLWQTLRMERTRGAAMKGRGFSLGVFACALMLMLTRKPSLYALLFALPFWLARYPGVRARITAALLGAALVFQIGYTTILLPACGVIPGETRETLSIPLQQMARVLTADDDLTAGEREAVARVTDIDCAKGHYDPRLSDPVKDSTNPDMGAGDLAAFASAWASVGLRHPGAYLDAWLNMIYGYFYPSDSNTIVCLTLNSPDRGGVQLRQDASLDGARLKMHDLIYFTFRRLPGVSALFYVDTVTWAFLALLAFLAVRGGIGAALPHMFFAGTLGICLLSPKSGEIRYLLPVLYALPALLGAALAGGGEEGR